MLSGAPETIPPPAKPWEVSSQTVSSATMSSMGSLFAPPPPPPFPVPTINDPYSQSNSSGYYGNGYGGNRFGYSSNYNSSFNSFSNPHYGNNNPYGGVPPAPGSFLTSSLENTARPLFDSLNHVLQAINHVACFVDSTVFAIWTSVTAAGSIVTAMKNIKNVYWRQWAEYIKVFLQKLKANLRTESGRKRLLLLVSVAVSIPFLIKSLHTILNLENDAETAIVLRDRVDGTGDAIDPKEDDISSKTAFVRALYSFDPTDKDVYLRLNSGDVILISKEDERKLQDSNPSWIAGKLKSGLAGFFPSNYVTVIK